MATPNISFLLTTTLQHAGRELADNFGENNAILFQMQKKGKRLVSGGYEIREPILHAENGNAAWIDGYDTFTVGATEEGTSATFDPKQLVVPVSISEKEMLQNQGKEQLIDLLDAKRRAAKITMKNFLSEGAYGDGTGSGGKALTGILLMCPLNPLLGSYGGISRVTWDFWRSGIKTNTSATATVQADMNVLYNAVSRGNDHPDLIMAGATTWGHFLGSLQTIQRITDPKLAEAGFENLKYIGAAVVPDGGIGGNLTATHQIFLNTDYFHYRPYAGADMVVVKPEARAPANQLASTAVLHWMGNFTCSGARFQGRYNGA